MSTIIHSKKTIKGYVFSLYDTSSDKYLTKYLSEEKIEKILLAEAMDKFKFDFGLRIKRAIELGSSSPLHSTNHLSEIIYKDGDKITGNEKVIKTEVIAGATCNFISNFCFWVSTRGLVLLQNNLKAINSFSTNGYKDQEVVKRWRRAKLLPDRIYFVKRDSTTSCGGLENIYETVGPRITLNVQAAFNVKYPKLHKKFPNGIQRKDSKGEFCYAIFNSLNGDARVGVDRNAGGWNSCWWFPLSI